MVLQRFQQSGLYQNKFDDDVHYTVFLSNSFTKFKMPRLFCLRFDWQLKTCPVFIFIETTLTGSNGQWLNLSSTDHPIFPAGWPVLRTIYMSVPYVKVSNVEIVGLVFFINYSSLKNKYIFFHL